MEKLSLDNLFLALKDPDNEHRSEAELFVTNMIDNQRLDFVEKIIQELIELNPNSNQVYFSFIIIKRFSPFYTDYQKVIDLSLRYFRNQDEQIRVFAVDTFCTYFLKLFFTQNDESSIQKIFSLVISEDIDLYTFESCIKSTTIIADQTHDSIDFFLVLCNFIFDYFLKNQVFQKDIILMSSINIISPYASEGHITNELFINKLLTLIEVMEAKTYVYTLFTTFFKYFYSSDKLNPIIFPLMEISCKDMTEIGFSSIIHKIISMWRRIAMSESKVQSNEIVYHYINTCCEQVTPCLLQILQKRIDSNLQRADDPSEWTTSKAALETIGLFYQISINQIYPLLIQFINQSGDAESNLFLLSILGGKIPDDENFFNQIPAYLGAIFANVQSNSERIRYAALRALNSFSMLSCLTPENFEPFINHVFIEEWSDIEQNAVESFEIFSHICDKLDFDKQVDNIVNALKNINMMHHRYIQFFLDVISNNIKIIIHHYYSCENIELIYNFLVFIFQFLEISLEQIKDYYVVESVIYIINSFLNYELPLGPIFENMLNTLMRAFSEYTIPFIPFTLSALILSDIKSSLPFLPGIVQFFVSLLENKENMTLQLTNFVILSLSALIYADPENQSFIEYMYNYFCKLLISTQDGHPTLISSIFGFFESIVEFRPIDDMILQILFKIINNYFALPENQIHDIDIRIEHFHEGLVEFIINLFENYPQSFNNDYLQTSLFVCNVIKSLDYKPEKLLLLSYNLSQYINKPDIN